MKPKFLTQLFFLALISFSLYSCTDDTADDNTQKSTVTPEVSASVADDGTTVVEPRPTNPK